MKFNTQKKIMTINWIVSLSIGLLSPFTLAQAPASFSKAKPIIYKIARAVHNETLYCSCPIVWHGKKGVPDLKTCGYKVRKQERRANRIEAEHIVSAWELGHQLPCWKKGGRKACKKDDEYNKMAGDLYNLWPAIGEVNADRNNFVHGIVTSKKFATYGKCTMKIDFKNKLAEPPNSVKGLVGRTYLYMANKYHFSLSDKRRKLYESWDKQYPKIAWEIKRDKMIDAVIKN